MFTIIGGDGKEYGPVTVEQMRQWLAAGRANLETHAKKDGDEQWRRIGDFVEFAPADAAPPVIGVDSSLAGRGARTGAALINAAVYGCCMLPGMIATTMRAISLGAHSVRDMDPVVLASGVNVLWIGVGAAIALQATLLAIRGQNIGMVLTGLRVVRFADNQPAGFVHAALLRFLVPVSLLFLPWVSFLGFIFLCVDYCFLFRDDRRCVHDLMAGTKVVKK
jgi:uncharacterized RDD family membrane protein YckC